MSFGRPADSSGEEPDASQRRHVSNGMEGLFHRRLPLLRARRVHLYWYVLFGVNCSSITLTMFFSDDIALSPPLDFPVPATLTRAFITRAPKGATMNQRTAGPNASIDLNNPGINQNNVILGERPAFRFIDRNAIKTITDRFHPSGELPHPSAHRCRTGERKPRAIACRHGELVLPRCSWHRYLQTRRLRVRTREAREPAESKGVSGVGAPRAIELPLGGGKPAWTADGCP